MVKLISMSHELKQIDETAALNALGGDKQLLCELATICGEDAPQLLSSFNSAIQVNDLELARRLVHSLKGLMATFYARAATELAAQIEGELSYGSTALLRQGGAEELKLAVDSLIQELRALGYIT
jgi:two-component system, sensor histidine kinase and response regulator